MYDFIHSTYFQGIISGFSSGVIILNSDCIIYTVNKAAAEIFQKNKDEILSHNYEQFFAGFDQLEEFTAIVKKVVQTKDGSSSLEGILFREDGSRRHLSVSISPLLYYEKLFGIFIEIKDVTHIYDLHEQEKQILYEKKEVEKERTKSLQLFSLAVAHQIRNPVTIIGGLCRRLLHNHISEEQVENYLQTILASGERLEQITRAVNDFTSLQGVNPGQICLSEILQDIMPLLEKDYSLLLPNIAWSQHGVTIPFFCYMDLLKLALVEILRNAFEAMQPQGGTIFISCILESGTFSLCVQDTGCGISPNIRSFLFDPFFTTHEKFIGMGLCKVKRIMKEHQGSIRIESNNPLGTTVILQIPQEIFSVCKKS